jgi:hypothetical protein
MESGAATLRNAGDLVRNRLINRSNWHGLSGHRHQAEANGERRGSKHFHRYFLFLSRFAATRHNVLRKQHSGPITPKRIGLTSGGDASDAGASPNDADAKACAHGGPNGPPQASDDRRRLASRPLIPGFRHARA